MGVGRRLGGSGERVEGGRGGGYIAGNAGVIQLVECQLPKLDVAGSSPVARSSARRLFHLRERGRLRKRGRPFFASIAAVCC